MDPQLKAALDFSHYQQTFSIQKKVLKERTEAKLNFGHGGGIFYIDRELLTFVEILCQKQRTEGVVLLDKNNNPVLIDDLVSFRDTIFSRYFETTNEYFQQYAELKKSRSVEKLLAR